MTQQVYELVRDRIVAGELAPMTFIREDEVARGMAVSRTPVREALNRLASEGFLERFPHRGYRVPERSIDELVNAYVVLQGLELMAAELAFPRLTPADLERLEALNRGFRAALGRNDVATAVDLNDQFHHLLSEASGNPVLCSLLDDLRTQVRRLEVLDFTWLLLESSAAGPGPVPRDVWVTQHATILDAVRCNDFERARDVLRENRSFVLQAKVEKARGLASTVRVNDGMEGAR